jgi:hypothetical protein
MQRERRTRTRAASRAFTLIEVLIAGTVLVIASVALAATMAQTGGLGESGREEMVARNAIRSVVAALAAAPFDRVAADFHNQCFDVTGLTTQTSDADGRCGEVLFAYGPDDDTSFYTVTVRVRWRGRVGDRMMESVHYLANVRGDTGTPVPLEQIGASQGGGE